MTQQRLSFTDHDHVLETLDTVLADMKKTEQLLDELSNNGGHHQWHWRWSQWNTITRRIKRFRKAIITDQKEELR